MSKRETLLQKILASAKDQSLLKITLGNKRHRAEELNNIYIKPVIIKGEPLLSFVYRYPSKDITKNYSPEEATDRIRRSLNELFFNADVYTTSAIIYFSIDKKGIEKSVSKSVQTAAVTPSTHDRQKNRIINSDAFYLHALGVTGPAGNVKKEMQHKYKQINRYVEIIDGILKETDLKNDLTVADMGSGKGYLTFALYEYLRKKSVLVKVTGIEMREDLVDKCNSIAAQGGYKDLVFRKGSISETQLDHTDILIALHACDTATDDAIAKGINADAEVIICAPCCHKQIRREMRPGNALQLITKHGILLERQAEMVTDTIRSLMLEAHGYKTKVFEFIDEADTPKNVLIVGVKNKSNAGAKKENLEKIQSLKALFGIKEHYLETILD